MPTEIAILAKDLPFAKQRLRACLGRSGAERFAEQCLRRVIGAALGCSQPARVVVVTNGPATAAVASACGAAVWVQRTQGLGGAAQEALAMHPGRRRILLMADLPLLRSTDIDALLAASGRAPLLLVNDRHERGVNALALAPGLLFEPELGFGNGLPGNRRRAREQCAKVDVWSNDAFALDCDTEQDYEAFLAAIAA